MRRRGLRIAMLVFVALWFGVLLPVHTRGQIPLPGDGSGYAMSRACCKRVHERHPASDLPRRCQTCAVCYLIATLDVPPPVILYVPRFEFAGEAIVVAPESRVSRDLPRTCFERAPPVC